MRKAEDLVGRRASPRMHRSQSLRFATLREIFATLERARRELSNGTLISLQLPREVRSYGEPQCARAPDLG